jgi:hypothetical protein
MADSEKQGTVEEIVEHLGTIFRHMLPGVLVVGTAYLAYPQWYARVNLESWQHIVVLTLFSIVVGNVWFAVNRYVILQVFDWVAYRAGWGRPAKAEGKQGQYLFDLAGYTYKSLQTSDNLARARRFVSFRASIVLLLFTIGELLCLVPFLHSTDSVFEGLGWIRCVAGGIAVLLAGSWQMLINRYTDNFVVNPGEPDR